MPNVRQQEIVLPTSVNKAIFVRVQTAQTGKRWPKTGDTIELYGKTYAFEFVPTSHQVWQECQDLGLKATAPP